MVDDLVNHNRVPKLVTRPNSDPEFVAIFPESYDWKEESRVVQILDKVYKDRTDELWEELVRRTNQTDYCVVQIDPNFNNAKISTVGNICREIAYARLVNVYLQHIPSGMDGRRLKVKTGIDNLLTWRKQRASNSFYELQIEVCEHVLRELSSVKDDSMQLSRKNIAREIEKLKRTKRPVFLGEPALFPREFLHTPKLAKRIRDAVESGYTGEIRMKRD